MITALRTLGVAALLILVGLGASHAKDAGNNSVFGVPRVKWGMTPIEVARLYKGLKHELIDRKLNEDELKEYGYRIGLTTSSSPTAFDGLPGGLLFQFDKSDKLVRVYYGATLLRYPIETDLGLKEFQALVSTYDRKLQVDPKSPGMDKDYDAVYKSWISGVSRVELAASQNPPGFIHFTITRIQNK